MIDEYGYRIICDELGDYIEVWKVNFSNDKIINKVKFAPTKDLNFPSNVINTLKKTKDIN